MLEFSTMLQAVNLPLHTPRKKKKRTHQENGVKNTHQENGVKKNTPTDGVEKKEKMNKAELGKVEVSEELISWLRKNPDVVEELEIRSGVKSTPEK